MVADSRKMASNESISNPPILDDSTQYDEWKKDVAVWKLYTNTPDEKKGPRLYLSLRGKAREIVREIDTAEIGAENGMDKILEKLDGFYKTDMVQRAYVELEQFESYRRNSSTDMKAYVSKFERRNNKIKEHQMVLPDGVLAYKLLHHANLGDNEVNLIKATMTELSYQAMKTKLQNIFSDITKITCKSEPLIKVEQTMYNNNNQPENTYYSNQQ